MKVRLDALPQRVQGTGLAGFGDDARGHSGIRDERLMSRVDPDRALLLVDGHVHVYSAEQLPHVLIAAAKNFAVHAPAGGRWSGLLLVADPQGTDSAAWLAALSERPPPGWAASRSADPLLFHFRTPGGQRLSVLRGQQLASAEGLEVLAIGAAAPASRAALTEMIGHLRSEGCLVVIPWGVGKWLGRRGRLLEAALSTPDAQGVVLGDNGGRPWFWPREALIARAQATGIPLLPGTDPLPLPGEEMRVGTTGAMLAVHEAAVQSVPSLLATLAGGGWTPFGRRMGAWPFLRNQIGLRLARRGSRK
jgi:hypothetical protein